MKYSPMLTSIFAVCEDYDASDVHIMPGIAPRFRMRGALVEKGGFAPFESEVVDAIAMELGLTTLPVGTSDGTERVRAVLAKGQTIDGAVSSETGVRYRFNIFRDNAHHAIAIRKLDSRFRSFEELGLPERLMGFCSERDGLVIVSGPTGSGKSTTLATLIAHINANRSGHIITIEDPIEFVHPCGHCVVNQRQVGRDTLSFNDALKEALRQDPDVILVGEMRDLDTMRTALRASETGHLVFATLHAGDCIGALERMLGVFPADEQQSVRSQLALVLRGIFAQHLLLCKDGLRHPACELMVNCPSTANLIATGRFLQLYSAIETGGGRGMLTLDQSLEGLYADGFISRETALATSRNPEQMLSRLGKYTEQ